MFNPTHILITAFIQELRQGYHALFGSRQIDCLEGAVWGATVALESIGRSDALYHNLEHTMLVTLTGHEILRGKQLQDGGVTPEIWLNLIVALVCHDVGYVRGACHQDSDRIYSTGQDGQRVFLPEGATDAALRGYHVSRGQCFVAERFWDQPLIDLDFLQNAIEMTRFPIPDEPRYHETASYGALARAADLIGQLADPRYLQKLPALFYEFEETDGNPPAQNRSPEDLRRSYPEFYRQHIEQYLQPALRYLHVTHEGQAIATNLYANLYMVEHEQSQSTSKVAYLAA
jgi:hypothetical protein